MIPELALCMPVFNEEEMLTSSAETLLAELQKLIQDGKIAATSFLCIIDDGSHDKSWQHINQLAQKHKNFVRSIKLSRNFGHQAALSAAYHFVTSDILITIDADLQDDISAISKMIDEYHKSKTDIVYGVRSNRDQDSKFKKLTALYYYKILRALDPDIVFNHADFRLMSRRAYKTLANLPERDLFLRGMVPKIGFSSSSIYYSRKKRLAGETKYPLRKMLSFAWSGLTATSVKPLRAVAVVGLSVFLFSLFLICWTFYTKFFTNSAVSGWASMIAIVAFFSGLNILCIAIVAEYMSKIFIEVKRRPKFLVDRLVGDFKETKDES